MLFTLCCVLSVLLFSSLVFDRFLLSKQEEKWNNFMCQKHEWTTAKIAMGMQHAVNQSCSDTA